MNRLFNGNLNLSGGPLVLDNVSRAAFTSNRTGGFAASGALTWQLTGGGFAARTTDLTIDTTGSSYNVDIAGMTLGTQYDQTSVIGAVNLDADALGGALALARRRRT